jgi:hypothetical protein
MDLPNVSNGLRESVRVAPANLVSGFLAVTQRMAVHGLVVALNDVMIGAPMTVMRGGMVVMTRMTVCHVN